MFFILSKSELDEESYIENDGQGLLAFFDGEFFLLVVEPFFLYPDIYEYEEEDEEV